VDGGTASAAEIIASGLEALAGARVVGRTPVGKRSIQTTLRYEDGSALQLTIGRFEVAGGALRVDASMAADADEAAWWSTTCGW
jgi:carboxyl-terminal processing protease